MAITGGGSENLIVNNKKIVGLNLLQDTINNEGVSPCLSAGSPTGQAAIGVATEYIVRRLTPLECERLQGFPDGWTDIGEWVDTKGKVHKESTDSARYKALGNSVAIPCVEFIMSRIAAALL